MTLSLKRLEASLLVLFLVTAIPALAQDSEEGERLNAFFEEVHQAAVARWPEWQSHLGLKDNQDKWNDYSDARSVAELEITTRNLARLRSEFDYDKLNARDRVSYKLFERQAEQHIAWFPFRHHNYPVNQMGGAHKGLPAFMINTHAVDAPADAEAYIARLRGIEGVMDQVIENLGIRAAKGIVPPEFVFPLVLIDIERVLHGRPFDDSGEDTPILADFKTKVGKLDLADDRREALVEDAIRALSEFVHPAYERLMTAWKDLEKQATNDHGVWKFPNGDAYYAFRLKSATTTDLSAEEIHAYGLAEVERIHGEMRILIKKLGFKGTLQDFFTFVRNDDSNFYPNTDAGRAAYLTESRRVLDRMAERLDDYFTRKPKARLEVRRVEPFREQNDAGGFYKSPSVYGDRPGIYYVNLRDMRRVPKSHLEGLAYHEGLPGHHMQIALAQETEGIPKFRRFGGYTVYSEGWALYAERLGKEMGFYEETMSDFGRLAWELLRAARLVADTGLHAKRWTRQETVAYLDATLPQTRRTNKKAVSRYIVWPAQATTYKIGMRRILELRDQAQRALGDAFDIRAFHAVILDNGAVPLDVLEELVQAWIETVGK